MDKCVVMYTQQSMRETWAVCFFFCLFLFRLSLSEAMKRKKTLASINSDRSVILSNIFFQQKEITNYEVGGKGSKLEIWNIIIRLNWKFALKLTARIHTVFSRRINCVCIEGIALNVQQLYARTRR